MRRYWRRKKFYPKRTKKMSDFEKFSWIVAGIVFVIAFVYYMISGFLANCVFHWPIRWDVGVCWHEQAAPSQQKAMKTAEPFAPL